MADDGAQVVDKISIEGLAVETIIGVHDWEREQKQTVMIDLQLFTSTDAAARSDDVAHTIGYGDVARYATEFVESSHFNLIESLASALSERILERFPVTRLNVTVSKPGAVENAGNVSVSIERSR